MCLIAVAWQAHDEYPLVVAGNRDEFFARPTAAADWSSDGQRLGGRDLQAGGTWMGVARRGRFAALTNHRDPTAMRSDAPSRGALVDTFLDSGDAAPTALARIADDAPRYNGFNLLAAEWAADAPAAMWIVSAPGDSAPLPVSPGVHALSNARLDTPWPKVDRATAAMRRAIDRAGDRERLIDDLFALLADRTIADERDLPRTGVPREVERALSAPFIRMPGYGTRASTVVVLDRAGGVTFVERTCEPERPMAERRFSFVAGPTLSAARDP